MARIVEFSVPGKITSANRVTRRVGNRSLKSESAREDAARIGVIAFAAKVAQGWTVPERARITIFAYNSRLDVDNISKTVNDSIKRGLIIVDDRVRHLRAQHVEHMDPDDKGERYHVRVEAVEPLPKKRR